MSKTKEASRVNQKCKGSLYIWIVTSPDCNEMKNGKVGEMVNGQLRYLERQMKGTQSLYSIQSGLQLLPGTNLRIVIPCVPLSSW